MSAYLDRIDARNDVLNAIVSLRDRDELLVQSALCDDELDQESLVAGCGFPHAVKDLAETKGLLTTKGSPLLKDFVPDVDALHVERIRSAGAIIIGKTNVPEFGLGSHTFNPVFGATVNPYDSTKVAGGSSGGAAVALATRYCQLPMATTSWGHFATGVGATLSVFGRASVGCHCITAVTRTQHFAQPMARWGVE